MLTTKQTFFKSRKILLAVAIVLIGGIYLWRQSTNAAQAHRTTPPPKPDFAVTVAWPTDVAAAAVGIQDQGVIASHNDAQQRPIASVAKVITAMAILQKHPLSSIDDPGPSIPITEADEQLYRDYVAKNGTVALVKAGVPISERDALEAMLLPSANNVADTTAIWAFGSLKKYHDYAASMLGQLNLHSTTIGIDASGLDPSTTSTASDLVRIGELALKNPIIAHIALMHSAYIPVAGGIPNYNAMVTNYGYTGLKPGESIQAGNTLLFSTDQTINGVTRTIVGATLNSPGYKQSDQDALQIVDSVVKTLKPN